MSTTAHTRPRISGLAAVALGLVVLGGSASLTSCAPAPARALEAHSVFSQGFQPQVTPTLNYQATAQSSSMQTALITAQAQQRTALQQATATERAWQVQQATMQADQARAMALAQAQSTSTAQAAQAQATATAQSVALTATPAYGTQVAMARAIERENMQVELARKAAPWWAAFKIAAAFLCLYLVYAFASRLMPPSRTFRRAMPRPGTNTGWRLPLPERELLILARALQHGVPFDELHFGPRAVPHLREVQEAAVSAGLATWIDPSDWHRGCVLTARGERYFFDIVLKETAVLQMVITPPLTR